MLKLMIKLVLLWILLGAFQAHSAPAEGFKSADEEALRLIQDPALLAEIQNSNEGLWGSGCDISMPKIASDVVFQSVEAPQIEPMPFQEKPPFKEYDLVMHKPAGILVELEKRFRRRMERVDFALGYILSDRRGRYYGDCFKHPFGKGNFPWTGSEEELPKGGERPCVFNRADFPRRGDNFFKFFPLPMDSLRTGKTRVSLLLFPKGRGAKCLKHKSFTVNVIKTKDIKIGFTRIVPASSKCKYSPVSSSDLRGFASSKDMKEHISSLFPVRKAEFKVLEYAKDGRLYDYVEGSCVGKTGLGKFFRRLIDMNFLNFMRWRHSYDRLVALADAYYLQEIGFSPGAEGAATQPKALSVWLDYAMPDFLDIEPVNLAMHVAIMTLKPDRLDIAHILAHELGHAFGQGREFYNLFSFCRRFKGGGLDSCVDYRVDLSLKATSSYWKFVKNRWSIMNARPGPVWMDRETYQKAFYLLARRIFLYRSSWNRPQDSKPANTKADSSSLKAVVSGFYAEKDKNFLSAKTKVYQSDINTASYSNKKIPVITLRLKEGKTLIKEIKRPILKYNMKFFYENKLPDKKPFPYSHIAGAFPLPENYKKRDLSIQVFNPEGVLIYEAPVPKKQEPKVIKTESVS